MQNRLNGVKQTRRQIIQILGWSRMNVLTVVLGFVLGALAGCRPLGPNVLDSDRFNYSDAIAKSFKEQMLLKIVRLRYFDTPTFVDVSNILSGYSLTTSAGGSLKPYDARDSFGLDGEVLHEERSTISYEVVRGSDFTAALLEPIDVSAIWVLIEMGYDAELLLRTACQSINGLGNREVIGMRRQPADPRFDRVAELSAGTRADRDELRRLPRLAPEVDKFTLLYSVPDPNNQAISFESRSVIQVLLDLAGDVDVPQAHLNKHYTVEHRADEERCVRIQSGDHAPPHAYVAVKYRDAWFWIEQNDLQGKAMFTLTALLYRLKAGHTPGDRRPVLTIPAG